VSETVPDSKLVYSTDPKLNEKCPRCREVLSECTCPPKADVHPSRFVAALRIEKQGRGGKVVTAIDGLPKESLFLKDLTKELKNRCGAGGTFRMEGRDGRIEIQGDKRDAVRALLAAKGIRTKG
jgi:translation initiation factor 1